MAMKQQLVRQLRALEKESFHIEKQFDIYSSGGHGLLEEMSAQLEPSSSWLKDDYRRKKMLIVGRFTRPKLRQKMLLEKSRVVTQMRHVSRAQWISKKAGEEHYDKEEINPAYQLGL